VLPLFSLKCFFFFQCCDVKQAPVSGGQANFAHARFCPTFLKELKCSYDITKPPRNFPQYLCVCESRGATDLPSVFLFRCVYKVTKLDCQLRYGCPPVCVSVRTEISAPIGWNSMKFSVWYFSEIFREDSTYIKIWQELGYLTWIPFWEYGGQTSLIKTYGKQQAKKI
jgi:hypothetical protein